MAQPRFVPWTGQGQQGSMPGGPAAPSPAPPSARFTPLPRGAQGPALPGQGQTGTAQRPDLAAQIGVGLGGLNTGLAGLNLANQAGGNPLGNLVPLGQGAAGLSGLFNVAQGIRTDNPLTAIGGGLTAAQSLSGLLGGPPATSLLGPAAGYAIPGIGAALGIVQNALAGNIEPEKQAFDASLAAVAAGLAPMTGGLSLLAPVAMALGGPLFGEKPSVYDAKRNIASRQVDSALVNMSQALGGSLQQFVQTGDLSTALAGLRAQFGGAAGNSVRSQLQVPPSVATTLGFPDAQVQWDRVDPQRFTQLLQAMAAQPDQGMSWVIGSGDIPYVNQAAAQNVAAEVKAQTGDYLHFVMSALGLVPATPWTSLYAPYVAEKQRIRAVDAAAMDVWNSPQFQNPEGYQPTRQPRDPATDIWSGSA